MRKSIIARLLSQVNASVSKAEERLDAVVGRTQATLASELYVEAVNTKEVLMSLIHAAHIPVGKFQWEFEGGDAHSTSKLIPGCMWTAYSALAHAYFVENELYQKDEGPLADWTELMGSMEDPANQYQMEEDDFNLSFDDALVYAKAVLTYGYHIAMFKGRDFRWLLSMDVSVPHPVVGAPETQTINILKPFKAWVIDRLGACKPNSKAKVRWSALRDDLNQHDWFMEKMPTIEATFETMKLWLHMDCFDGVCSTRHERIVSRAADRRYETLVASFLGNQHKEVVSAAKPWELILCSQKMAHEMAIFKASEEWIQYERAERLDKLAKLADEADRKEKLEAENKRLDDIEKALMIRLGLIQPDPVPVAAPEPVAAPAPEPVVQQVTVNVTQKGLSGIAGTRSAFAKGYRR